MAASDATVFLHARGGPVDHDVWAMRIAQVGRPTSSGCEVRSRFWFGTLDPPDVSLPDDLMKLILSEENAAWQMTHCIEEYRHLAEFLPDLYARSVSPA